MNIRKLNTSNRPLLTIDDPSVYSGEHEGFIRCHVYSSLDIIPEEEKDSETLFLIGTDNNYEPYV